MNRNVDFSQFLRLRNGLRCGQFPLRNVCAFNRANITIILSIIASLLRRSAQCKSETRKRIEKSYDSAVVEISHKQIWNILLRQRNKHTFPQNNHQTTRICFVCSADFDVLIPISHHTLLECISDRKSHRFAQFELTESSLSFP